MSHRPRDPRPSLSLSLSRSLRPGKKITGACVMRQVMRRCGTGMIQRGNEVRIRFCAEYAVVSHHLYGRRHGRRGCDGTWLVYMVELAI